MMITIPNLLCYIKSQVVKKQKTVIFSQAKPETCTGSTSCSALYYSSSLGGKETHPVAMSSDKNARCCHTYSNDALKDNVHITLQPEVSMHALANWHQAASDLASIMFKTKPYCQSVQQPSHLHQT